MKITTSFKSTLYILLVAIVAMAALPANAQRRVNSPKPNMRTTVVTQIKNAPINNTKSSRIQELINYAFKFEGTPYRSGASSPRGFDCSGFTSYVFKKFGVSLNRSSRGQVSDGRRVSRNELKPGDLVFFNGRAIGNRIGHVGIVTEANNDKGTFKFIHAASRGVRESKSTETYYQRRYMGACRPIE